MRALGPQAWPGRGRGIRDFDDYLDALRKVEGRIAGRKELAHRLRIVSRPFQWDFMFIDVAAEWAVAPRWYWDEADANSVEPSVCWETAATTGHIDLPRDAGPAVRVSVWPLWLVLGGPQIVPPNPLLEPGVDQPAVWPKEIEQVTVLGLVARAWIAWNRVRRVARGGRPVAEWAAQETAAFDPLPLRKAVASAAPREDLDGCIDALVIARSERGEPASALLQAYYGPVGLDGRWNDRNRISAFFETAPPATAFHGLSLSSATLPQELKRRLGPLLRWMVRLCGQFESWWNEREINTPWGLAALELLTDELTAVLAGQSSAIFGEWPGAGFGVRGFDAAHRAQPLYGNWDLQFGDDDAGPRFAGKARPGDVGGHVAALVGDLRSLGFTAPAAGTTQFDARVAMAVREFQVESAQARWSLDSGGVLHAQQQLAPRRYFGRVHGIVDGETRRMLQLWLNLPALEQGAPPLGPLGTQARNGLQVVACAVTQPNVPVAAAVVSADIWGAMGNPVAGVDDFDYMTQGRRHWAIDRLMRWGDAVAADAPTLADFGEPVPPAGIDATPLGRFHQKGAEDFDIGGPSMRDSDHWQSTRLTWARFQDPPSADMPARQTDWRVLYGMTYPETFGHEDVLNGWDQALLSIGWCHWTLALAGGAGEMGAMLSWYRHRDPAGFHRDLGRFGLHAPPWGQAGPVLRVGAGKYVARIPMWGAGDPAQRLARVQPQVPDAAQRHLEHTWMRSWRMFYRFHQALRLSPGMRRANREFSLRRLGELMGSPWGGGGGFDAPATIGHLVCSERAAVALMRWHINRPNDVVHADGGPGGRLNAAVASACAAYRAAAGLAAGAPIPLASLADPALGAAIAFQGAAIDGLLADTGPGEARETVAALSAVGHAPPGEPPFSGQPGSYTAVARAPWA
ncbi:hypothetical protein [Ramlibacter sp. AN1133]|uniref:hypothetical protein n=1 Tax=Ramlibacter sp. AN1133 TaxID=3133429 RepID=UPI0030C1CBEE